jgi:hypothetical protein
MKIRAGEWDTQQTNEPLEYQVKLFLISISIRKTILNNFCSKYFREIQNY